MCLFIWFEKAIEQTLINSMHFKMPTFVSADIRYGEQQLNKTVRVRFTVWLNGIIDASKWQVFISELLYVCCVILAPIVTMIWNFNGKNICNIISQSMDLRFVCLSVRSNCCYDAFCIVVSEIELQRSVIVYELPEYDGHTRLLEQEAIAYLTKKIPD